MILHQGVGPLWTRLDCLRICFKDNNARLWDVRLTRATQFFIGQSALTRNPCACGVRLLISKSMAYYGQKENVKKEEEKVGGGWGGGGGGGGEEIDLENKNRNTYTDIGNEQLV